MRALVDIPEDTLALLKKISSEGRVSRAEIIRRAVAQYLEPWRRAEKASVFGLWAERQEGGVEYQERMRSEWPE